MGELWGRYGGDGLAVLCVYPFQESDLYSVLCVTCIHLLQFVFSTRPLSLSSEIAFNYHPRHTVDEGPERLGGMLVDACSWIWTSGL